jgi:hypothetical protein
MPRRMVSTTAYLEADQVDKLRLLSERTKVPVAEYVRQGIDLALAAREPEAGIISTREDR